MNNISTEKLVKIIEDANTFLIVTHKRPDGDAISSSLAMLWYLLDIGKKKTSIDVIIPEYTKELSFISGIEYLKAQPTKERYDLALIVDCAELRMLEGIKWLELANETICIDHHEKQAFYADYNVVNEEAVSTTSIIYEIFPCTSTNYLTCIATGLISDTSNLTLNVTPVVRNIIKKLEQAGIHTKEIAKKLSTTSDRTEELVQLARQRGKFVKDTTFCSYLLQEDLLEYEKNLTNVNHKLIIQELQNEIKFESLILLIENEQREFKGSLRTLNPTIDLNKVCLNLVAKRKIIKGGGHSYSAGCTAVGSYNDLFEAIAEEINNI